MLRHIDDYTSVGLVVAGVVQAAPRIGVSMGKIDELWFIGTGLALSLLGLLNLIRISAKMPVVALICVIANVIGILYLLTVVRLLPTPPLLLVLAMTLIVTLCSLFPKMRASARA